RTARPRDSAQSADPSAPQSLVSAGGDAPDDRAFLRYGYRPLALWGGGGKAEKSLSIELATSACAGLGMAVAVTARAGARMGESGAPAAAARDARTAAAAPLRQAVTGSGRGRWVPTSA